MSVPGELCIIGDFNIHCDLPDLFHTSQLYDVLSALDLKQHMSEPTHSAGHTLDLVITRNDSPHRLGESISVDDIGMCDHFAVRLLTCPQRTARKMRVARPLKNISPDEIASELGSLLSAIGEGLSTDDLLAQFDSKVREVLDEHMRPFVGSL